jgi:excisionase family DNA binding protein
MIDVTPTARPLNPDPLLDIEQAAGFLFTSERHVRHLISKREITVTRIGNKVRFRISDLNTYVVTRTTPAKVGE